MRHYKVVASTVQPAKATDDLYSTSQSLACRPAHAMYFSTYEAVKSLLGVRRSQHAPVATAAAGAAATVVNDAFMTPGDVIKQRMQIANSPYKGILDCISKTYRNEGIKAFFRSYKTTVRCLKPHRVRDCADEAHAYIEFDGV